MSHQSRQSRTARKAMSIVMSAVLAVGLCPSVALAKASADSGESANSQLTAGAIDSLSLGASEQGADLAQQASTVASGECGTCSWSIDSNGLLVIRPTNGTSGVLGEPQAIEGSQDDPDTELYFPWNISRWNDDVGYESYADSVKSVQVQAGVKAGRSISNMFAGLSLDTLDIANLDTSSVVDMSGLFKETSVDQLVDAGFDTGNVTDMSCMFENSNFDSGFDGMETWDASKVLSVESMFAGCNMNGLTVYPSFSNVEDARGMFTAVSIDNLDLSRMDNRKADCEAMFAEAWVAKLKVGSSFSFERIDGIYSLPGMPSYDDSTHEWVRSYWHSEADGKDYAPAEVLLRSGIADTYTPGAALEAVPAEAVPVESITVTSAAVSLEVNQGERLDAEISPFNATNKNIEWQSDDSSIAKVDGDGYVLAVSVGQTTVRAYAADGSGVSGSCVVTVTESSYGGDETILDSGQWGTCPWELSSSGVLTIKPGRGRDTDGENPWGEWCSVIKRVVFKSEGSSKVIAPEDCSKLLSDAYNSTSIDLSGLDTSYVCDMWGLFNGCGSLVSLGLTSLNTSNVEDMDGMFEGCSSLLKLDLSTFDTSSVRYMNNMFYGCSSLTSLDLSSFDTSSVYNTEDMFRDCKSVATVYVGEGWDLSDLDATDSAGMFASCESIVGGNGTRFDSAHLDGEYARIDTPKTPGYLTGKGVSGGGQGESPGGGSNGGGSSATKEPDASKASKTSIAGASVSGLKGLVYTGSNVEPSPIVTVGGKKLRARVDYTVSFTTASGKATNDVVAAGSYKAVVTSKGNYAGTKTAAFAVAKAANPLTAKAKSKVLKAKKSKKTVFKKAKAFKVAGAAGKVTFKKLSGPKKVAVAKGGKVTVKKGLKPKAYKVKVQVTAAGDANHNAATKVVTLKVKVKK